MKKHATFSKDYGPVSEFRDELNAEAEAIRREERALELEERKVELMEKLVEMDSDIKSMREQIANMHGYAQLTYQMINRIAIKLDSMDKGGMQIGSYTPTGLPLDGNIGEL